VKNGSSPSSDNYFAFYLSLSHCVCQDLGCTVEKQQRWQAAFVPIFRGTGLRFSPEGGIYCRLSSLAFIQLMKLSSIPCLSF
jgi:hypothetical protein